MSSSAIPNIFINCSLPYQKHKQKKAIDNFDKFTISGNGNHIVQYPVFIFFMKRLRSSHILPMISDVYKI